jgi:hypothetical protein
MIFMMGAVSNSETSVNFYEATSQNIPNVVAEWLTMMIRQVPYSNLSPETGYLD